MNKNTKIIKHLTEINEKLKENNLTIVDLFLEKYLYILKSI